MIAEVLREFEGATILEIRPAPAGAPPPAEEGAGEREPDEGTEEAEEAE
jgi:hypothetical protein